jgi:hypothetical protein
MKRTSSLICILLLFLIGAIGVSAYDTRINSLNGPTISHSRAAAAAGLGSVIFPTDEFGVGLSAVPDPVDIWRLPSRLADSSYFGSQAILLNYDGASPSAGFVSPSSGLPLTVGIFALRPDRNGWVTGSPRDNLAGLGLNFEADAGTAAASPAAPSNILDVLVGYQRGNLMIGGGAGLAYEKTVDDTSSIDGTADSTTTEKSTSSVITVRAGVTLPVSILTIDAGAIAAFSSYKASYESGAAAAPPNENDSVTAGNLSLGAGVRLAAELGTNLEGVFLADFVNMPQKYEAVDNGTDLDNTTTRIDPVNFFSIGAGAGVNWRPAERTLVNALLTAVRGSASWTAEAPGAGTRPEDSLRWLSLRAVLGTEYHPLPWLFLRGGLGGSYTWTTDERDATTAGTDSESTTTGFAIGATAGLGFLFSQAVELDFLLNLTNFTSATFFQTPAMQAAMRVNL